MDRKGWIAITLCLILMGLNFYFMQENAALAQEKAKAVQAQKAAEKAANPTAESAKTSTEPAKTSAAPATPAQPEQKHSITTGSVTYEFSSQGGGIARAVLAGTDRVTLNEHALEPIGALRREPAGADAIAYSMSAASEKSVTFTGTSSEGITIQKTYTLTAGEESDEHLIDLTLTLTNTGTTQHRSEEYYLFTGASNALKHADDRYQGFFWNDRGNASYEFSSYFAGGMVSSAKTEYRQSYSGLRFGGVMSRFYTHIISRMSDKDAPGKLWATRRLLPKQLDAANLGNASIQDYATEASISLPPIDLAPSASTTEKYQIYLGPKEYQRLAQIGSQRSYAMYYGWFGWVSIPLVKVMRWMHGFTGSWGLAVILLTIFVRLCIWPIHAKSTRSMKRMGLLAPMMKEVQEKHKDDPQKAQMEVLKLYKEYGVNPLSGCPMLLLQFPIFVGLYSMLEYAAELRGHGIWWINDLSAPDTVAQFFGFSVNPMPIIMALTMVATMKLTPQPQNIDKMQQRIFMLMPIMFLWFSYDFASALSLYWSTQNLFSIFQTWVMKLYIPEPKLEKVKHEAKPAAQSPFFNPMGHPKEKKKDKNKPPRLGG
jgi:YidC/Oxa1 family membrane protein insertase